MRQTLLRTKETHARYEEARERGMDSSFFLFPDRKILTWGIVANNFPYDAVASKHDLLFPLRKAGCWEDLSEQEMDDFRYIVKAIRGYDAIVYNLPHTQTVPDWMHVHLLTWYTTEDSQ